MKTTVEALEGNQKKIEVIVEAKEVDERIAKTYKDFAHKYNFPGFRAGKAPRPVIDNAMGVEAVPATVTDDIINNMSPVAMDEQDIIPIAQAKIDTTTELVEAGKPFKFTITVECRPEFELSNYDAIEVKLPSEDATDEEIEGQINEVLNYYFDFKDCTAATKIKKDNFVDLKMKATDDKGKDIDALDSDSRMYEMGSNVFPEAFDKELIGLKKGDTKSFEVSMKDSDCTMAQGMPEIATIKFDIEVLGVKVKETPELTDEWVKATMGFDSVAQMREKIAESIKQQKGEMIPRMRETEALYALGERLKGEAPESLCEQQEQDLLQNFFQQVQQQGVTFDAYLQQAGITADEFKEDLKKQAQDVANQDLALDAWARHAGIKITDKDITAEFKAAGVDNPKELEAQWREHGQMASLRGSMMRQRAMEEILKNLVVKPLDGKSDKKASGKKTAEKKTAEKKTTEKKPAAKKTAAKKTAAKKSE